jgi:long-chain acyl-CoA synthetase
MPLVLGFRFHPRVFAELAARHRPTFTIGAITAFIAWLDEPTATRERLESLTKVLSGGAPIAPAVAERWEREQGSRIHTAYGLTETTSPSHLVPLGARAPVDPVFGALSIGRPVRDTSVRILTDEGSDGAAGEIGELLIRGPQVVPGYWRRPDESALAMPGGELRTGDVGFVDDAGWHYLVDRRKDMIIASGYKVWPREVEDVLAAHPAVREVAVVGVPDDYRGETVKAVVSLRAGMVVDGDALIGSARQRLPANQVPRVIDVLDELPKTASGKILRRELRDATQPQGAAQ